MWECEDKKCVVAHHRHRKVRAPGVALGAAGKRCRGNAHRESQGSVFRANEAAERFHAAWAYVWFLAARTLVATRTCEGEITDVRPKHNGCL